MCMCFISCKDDNEKRPDTAPLYINGVDKANKSANKEALTASEIVRLDSVCLTNTNTHLGGRVDKLFCFGMNNIDTINNRLIMEAVNIDQIDNNLFLTNENWFISSWVTEDTLAYVPNAQLIEAYEQIRVLWEKEDWNAIYDIFQNAFSFVPCTGEELRELEKQGLW